MKSPQQEIFTLCMMVAMEVFGRENVYDYLPGDVNYPFAFIGEQINTDIPNKQYIFGEVEQTIHVYTNNHRKRGDFSKLINEFRYEIRKKEKTPSFFVSIKRIDSQIVPDNSTATPLLHAVISVTFNFN